MWEEEQRMGVSRAGAQGTGGAVDATADEHGQEGKAPGPAAALLGPKTRFPAGSPSLSGSSPKDGIFRLVRTRRSLARSRGLSP